MSVHSPMEATRETYYMQRKERSTYGMKGT